MTRLADAPTGQAVEVGDTWMRTPGDGVVETARLENGLWRGGIITAEGTEPLVDAPTMDAAFEFTSQAAVSTLERLLFAAGDWNREGIDLGGDVTMSIQHPKGEALATAILTNGEGRSVGTYLFAVTGWPGCAALRQPTLSGSVYLDESIQGKGYGKALYDTVEEIVGMKIVPHGRNLVQGGLNPSSTSFWNKRSAERLVPGFGDPDVDARVAELAVAMKYVNAEWAARFSPKHAAAMAIEMGWTVAGNCYSTEDGKFKLPRRAWCVTNDGKPFGARGFLRQDEIAPDRYEDGTVVAQFDPATLRDALFGQTPGLFMLGNDPEEVRRQALLVLERRGMSPLAHAADRELALPA